MTKYPICTEPAGSLYCPSCCEVREVELSIYVTREFVRGLNLCGVTDAMTAKMGHIVYTDAAYLCTACGETFETPELKAKSSATVQKEQKCRKRQLK